MLINRNAMEYPADISWQYIKICMHSTENIQYIIPWIVGSISYMSREILLQEELVMSIQNIKLNSCDQTDKLIERVSESSGVEPYGIERVRTLQLRG